MKTIPRAALLLQLLFMLCCLSFGQAPITASTSGTTVNTLTAGSYAMVTLAPGPNTLTIDVDGSYVGQLALRIAYQGKAGPLRAWPANALTDSLTSGATGMPANATGTWTATVSGPGYACVVATSLSSGTPSVFLSAGAGPNLFSSPVISSVPVVSTVENSTTTASAWKRVFVGGETVSRDGMSLRNKSASVAIRIAIVPKGAAAPSAADPEDDTQYVVYGGDTLPLAWAATYKVDVYIRAVDNSAVAYRAWETSR